MKLLLLVPKFLPSNMHAVSSNWREFLSGGVELRLAFRLQIKHFFYERLLAILFSVTVFEKSKAVLTLNACLLGVVLVTSHI